VREWDGIRLADFFLTSQSIFDLLLRLVHLHGVELLFVRVEGLRQDGVLGGLRRAVEVFLGGLVNALAVLDHLRLFVV